MQQKEINRRINRSSKKILWQNAPENVGGNFAEGKNQVIPILRRDSSRIMQIVQNLNEYTMILSEYEYYSTTISTFLNKVLSVLEKKRFFAYNPQMQIFFCIRGLYAKIFGVGKKLFSIRRGLSCPHFVLLLTITSI